MGDRAFRTLRGRQAEAWSDRDGRRGAAVTQGPALLVEVFAESAVPTATGKYFACHPVVLGGVEAEGETPSFAADAAQTLYVAVIGSTAPEAGDRLLSRLVDGRWLAEAGSSTPVACGYTCVDVYDCLNNLVIGATVVLKKAGVVVNSCTTSDTTVAAITRTAGGSGYTSAPTVTISGGGGTGATATATVNAVTHVVTGFTVTNPGTGYTGVPTVTVSGGGGTGAAGTAVLGGSCCVPFPVAGSGFTYVVSRAGYDTSTSTSFSTTCAVTYHVAILNAQSAPLTVHVNGCNSLPLQGATVTITQGATTVGGGTTDASGNFTATIPTGSYSTSVTHPRFATNTSTGTALQCVGNAKTVTMAPGTGHVCLPTKLGTTCVLPASKTLTLTDDHYGAVTMTYDAAGASGAGWYGSLAVTVPNCPFVCAGGAATINYYIDSNLALTAVASSAVVCVNGQGFVAASANGFACPTSLLMTWTYNLVGSAVWCTVTQFSAVE